MPHAAQMIMIYFVNILIAPIIITMIITIIMIVIVIKTVNLLALIS